MSTSITSRMPEGRRRAEERRRAQSSQGKSGAAAKAMPSSPAPQAAGSTQVYAGTRSSRQSAASNTGREASLSRRQALSSKGKAGAIGVSSGERTRAQALKSGTANAQTDTSKREGCGCGCRKEASESGTTTPPASSEAPTMSASPARAKVGAVRRNIGQPEGRQLSLARRRMLSGRGKAAAEQTERVRSPAQRARQLNPQLNGRDLAKEIRGDRSKNGGRGQKASGPCGRKRPDAAAAAAADASWKVGVGETTGGQSVTGTQVGRSMRVTGDEPSTCRTVTGTEYLGADIFREFCQTEAAPTPRKVSRTKTASGRTVTGTEVGRSKRVTGDEPGSCKRVTGNEYLPADQASEFCKTEPAAPAGKISLTSTARGRTVSGSNVDRPSRVTGTEAGAERATTGTPYVSPLTGGSIKESIFKKVNTTSTLRGGQVTGVVVGRSERVTGDEPGSCRQITGDEYIGAEQFKSFCGSTPAPEAAKIGLSETAKGKLVTGTQTGRSQRVTGDEPGTCKSVTGTPYAGMETYQDYCGPDASRAAQTRSRVGRATPGMSLTGLQPGIGGKMTGNSKGACEAISGTPYVGGDQFAAACGDLGAVPGNSDFPQALDGTPWTATFSVSTPARAAQQASRQSGVTGTRYEQGNITGPFVMGEGKITGTEQFRFGSGQTEASPPAALQQVPQIETAAKPKSRVTGEGIDSGLKITGDDWGRNERVTGTEGRSSVQRNPTRRGAAIGAMAMMARPQQQEKQSEPAPSRVTGSSGNTEKGALVTVSGGARG